MEDELTPKTLALLAGVTLGGYVIAYLYLSNVTAESWVYAAPALGPLVFSIIFTVGVPLKLLRNRRRSR